MNFSPPRSTIRERLKASWAAAKSGKNAVLAAEKKKQQQHQVPFAPVITSVSAPQEAVRRSPRKLQRKLSVSDEEEHISSSSDDDDSEAEPVSPIGETEDDRESAKPEVHEIIQTESEEEVKEIPQLTVKEKKAVTGRSKLKAKTGNAFNASNQVHAQSEDRIHRILRIFDLSYEYGPCVGVTRLERWKRAEELGLNPPTEVRDLLLSEKGEGELGENVFHRRV
ncbi:hypothetical protein FRC17_002472 [Serendipita sp. 399]|nr:hypothetical protein FRC17_002472 [Serendipita sp. 399]